MKVLLSLCLLAFCSSVALATSNYTYGADEYVTVAKGISPNCKWAITTHGDGDLGYDNFHVYLTNAVTGKRIGPLEEIVNTLDTGADAFCAKWSDDSARVTIIYRISRHEPLKEVVYRIGNGRAYPLKGPVDATDNDAPYWGAECSQSQPSPKIFGTHKPKQQ